MKKRIYVMFEVKKRELEARLLFALIASSKGYSVVIANKADIWARRYLLRPGIVICKSLGPGNINMVNDIIEAGHEVVAWDEESLVTPYKINYFIKRRISRECLKKAKYFFSWGEIEHEYLTKEFSEYKEKLFKTGNSRIDLFRNNNIKIFDDEANELKNKYGEFCLLLGNFGRANNSYIKSFEDFVNGLIKEGTLKKDTKDFLHVKNSGITQVKVFNEFPNIIEKFSKNFPNKKMIIRPHPVENVEPYKKMCKNLKNVIVVFDDRNVISWINAADFSISSNCTTSTESYLSKKLSINFWPFDDQDEAQMYLPTQVSLQAKSTDELMQLIKKLYDENDFKISKYLNTENINKELKRAFYNFEPNVCSTSEILKQLEKIEIKNLRKDIEVNFFLFYYYSLRSIIKKIIFPFLYLFRSKESKKWAHYVRSKNKGINYKEVKKKFLFLNNANKMQPNDFEVKEIIPRIFKIENIK